MAALPASTDHLIEKYSPRRRDFDDIRREVASIPIQSMTATLAGQERSDQLAEWDNRAKQFIDAWGDEHGAVVKSAYKAYIDARTFHDNMISAAKELRREIRERQSAYQLAVQRKIDDERRELERQQREQAEAERAAQLAELRAREEAARAHAQNTAADAAAREEAAREEARLAAEASEVAAAPPVPAAVSTTALAERYKVPGQTGNKVFLRKIINAVHFLTWASSSRQAVSITIPKDKRNTAILMLAGIEITVNFAGLRKSDAQIPGVEVTATVDTRNTRR